MDTFITRLNGMMMLELENLDKEIAKYEELSKKSSDELTQNIKNKTAILNNMKDQSFKKSQENTKNKQKVEALEKEYNEIIINISLQDEENKKKTTEIDELYKKIQCDKSELDKLKYDYKILCDKITEINKENNIKKEIEKFKLSIKEKQDDLKDMARIQYDGMMKMIQSISLQPAIDNMILYCNVFKNNIMKEINERYNIKLNNDVHVMDIYQDIKSNYVKCTVHGNALDNSIQQISMFRCDAYEKEIDNKRGNYSYKYFSDDDIFNTKSINKLFNYYVDEPLTCFHKILNQTLNRRFYIQYDIKYSGVILNDIEYDNVSLKNIITEFNNELYKLHGDYYDEIIDTLEILNTYKIKTSACTEITRGIIKKTYGIVDIILLSIEDDFYNIYNNNTIIGNIMQRNLHTKEEKNGQRIIYQTIKKYLNILNEFIKKKTAINDKYFSIIYNHPINKQKLNELDYNMNVDISSHFDLFIEQQSIKKLKTLYSDLSRENIKMYCEKLLFDALGKNYDDIYELVYYTNHLIK